MNRKTVVVIGNGMVGHRFCERLVEYDLERGYQVVTFCEEPRPAYDRVNLTKYFEHRDAEPPAARRKRSGTPKTASRFTSAIGSSLIDRERRVVVSQRGREVGYDAIVLATGSAPFVPDGPGRGQEGGLRLPHDRGPGADPCLRRHGDTGGGDGRRPARARGRQGRPRPRARDPRRRVRIATDAAPGRRRGLADAARKDRGPGSPGPPEQVDRGVPRQRQGRGDEFRRRRAGSRSTWS